MQVNAITYPAAEGLAYSWTSLEVQLPGGWIPQGVVSLTYGFTEDGVEVFGQGTEAVAVTRGTVKYTAELELLENDLHGLLAILGNGFTEQWFNIVAQYSEGNDLPVITDTMQVKITGVEKANSQGTDALKRKVSLRCRNVDWNGLKAQYGRDRIITVAV